MKMKKSYIAVIVLSFLAVSTFSQTANADHYPGGPTTGQRVAYYSDSITNYGYNSLFNRGRASWGNISTKVQILYTPTASTTSDRYYVGTTATPGLLGLMTPFKNVNGQVREATISETWTYAAVSAYHNQIRDFGLSDDQIVAMVASHEIGHSLGLAHSPTQVYTVMRGQPNVLYSNLPTDYDKSELRRKWGN